MQYLNPSGQKVVDTRTGTSSQNMQGGVAVGASLTGINPVTTGFKDPFNTSVVPTGIDAFGITLMGVLPVDPGLNFIDIAPTGELYGLVAATANTVATARYIAVDASGFVACQLPTGASTAAHQVTQNTSLALLDDVPTAPGGSLTRGSPMMGLFDDTATTNATEDRADFVRITRLKAAHVNPRDTLGTELFTSPTVLADGTANPTITRIQSYNSVYNGSTHDRQRGDTLGTWVQGGIAHDSANSTIKPVKTGSRARTSHITAVASDDIADGISNVLGYKGVTLFHNNRTVTLTTAVADGTVQGDGFQTFKHFSLQVDQTGAVTSWTVVLEGSLDGATFTTLISATSATDNGKVIFQATGAATPVLYWRLNCTAIVLGGGTNIIIKGLGVQ